MTAITINSGARHVGDWPEKNEDRLRVVKNYGFPKLCIIHFVNCS